MTLGAMAPWVVELGRGLHQSALMLWETLWPLVLGFIAAGALQAFARAEGVRRRLGDHRPRAVVRAAGYGAASSSCSYAAAAMARSLVARGADFVAALVFMVASTNLVVELGIVLLVLMGWQFAASEFVGGAVMIALLALGGGLWFRGRQVSEVRGRLGVEGGTDAAHGPVPEPPRPPGPGPSRSRRVRSLAGWADAAGYTVADLSMVRGELLVGYTVAGFLTVAVPVGFWDALFLHGHGAWTTLENVAVGPLVAVASFVCSIGNVPLAAALWSGGISFGGVVAFVFADLITFPLLLVYRRYYGTRLTLRILSLFWVAMALAGLVTEGLFRAAGLVPAHHPGPVASA
ncbi:MAG TPA: permease, partial [Acidimicrobiales bacterium]|nr:permease [Acidimicrobiales bacterium]